VTVKTATRVEAQRKVEVLVVEDNPTQAQELQHLLEQSGFKARLSRDGEEALAALEEHKPGIVLTDIVMAGMDGFELCRRIRAGEELSDLPVVLVTSLANPHDVLKGLECGADTFIVKPFREDELLARLQYILLNRRLAGAKSSETGVVEVFFEGQRHFISSGRLQILNLLLSTYDTAVRKNHELERLRDELNDANSRLEEKVRERTADLRAEIAERQRAEGALVASERRFRGLFQRSLAGLFRSTPAGRILECNDTFARILGYEGCEEVLGVNAADLYCDPAQRAAIIPRLLADRRLSGLELCLRRKDGTPAWVLEDMIVLEEGAAGELVLEGNIMDVTGRRQAQEAVRHSAERFRALVQNSSDVISVLRADGNLTFVGPSVKAVLGYEPEELVGRNILEIVHPEDLPVVREAIRRVVTAAGAVETSECRMRDASGAWHVVESTGTNALDNPAVGGLVVHSRDICERRRFEEELRQAQKMEAVGRLASGVAHDFNNILQALLNQVELLRVRGDAGQSPRDFLGEVEQQVRRGAALTRQLLLFSRKEARVSARLDINDLVRSAATLLRRLIRADIAFVLDLAPEQLPAVVDAGQFEQVLMNLAVNASGAMSEGGTLTLATGAAGDERVWLSVTDTGCGIPEDIRGRIFEPFFTTKAAGVGSGLGLSVIHGIVTSHGGAITVESEPNRGTTFRVELPRAPSGEGLGTREKASEAVPLPRGKGERVLVVEDEGGARESLSAILTSLGYQVEAAASGEDAGHLPAESAFDVLLCDMMLPGISGTDLIRGLRARWPRLAVILMSGYTDDEAVQRGASPGAMHFLQKPFDMGTLAQALRDVLDTVPGTTL
jgi:two-component system cell cycle sensor histidine kinase/response regulator CckA